MRDIFKDFVIPDSLRSILNDAQSITIPESREELLEMAMGGKESDVFEVSYDIPNHGVITEASVVRCKNGAAVNYADKYMRRRDPDCMVVADVGKTDKPRYMEEYDKDFEPLRQKVFQWLKNQDLIVMPFMVGQDEMGYYALLVAPINAGFFAAGLADLQGFIPKIKMRNDMEPKAVIYLAPPFRHTHFEGKQIIVHNRLSKMHELYSFNLYPGPSAKKGIYGVLLNIGEAEGWITVHGSTVQVVTPYDNVITIMHEGASGGGKSEMLEHIHKQMDGRIILGNSTITGEKIYLLLEETCQLRPVTDDMALCNPSYQNDSKRLVVKDAENGWFLRLDHIKKYGTDPHHESLCIHPPEPLIFLNLDGAPNSTCLIWEHTMDEPGKPCPNPRVIMPRHFVPNIVDEPVEIDVRSFGVRTPPCTRQNPTYGILGLFHILPPGLAWLWRLVSPRGHDNPSITETTGMCSEGVGSYWPFATGKMVDQANLLLEQIMQTSNTRYILVPNQHVGIYKVGFMPQWIAREYLARRGSAKFRSDQLTPARCPLLGYALETLKVDGHFLPRGLLQVDSQSEVGEEGYDEGATKLVDFFKEELTQFLSPDLHPLGSSLIECCLQDGLLEDYVKLMHFKI